MFKDLLKSLRETVVKELVKALSEELKSELIGDVRNVLAHLNHGATFVIETERVGEGISSQVPLPKIGSGAAHGFDLYSPVDVEIPPMSSVNVPIGRKFKLPEGYGAVLWSRSGLAAKLGVERGAGLIDYDYGDEWIVVLRNHSQSHVSFKSGERIAQAFLLPRYAVEFVEVEKVVVENDRGGGLGHTGMN